MSYDIRLDLDLVLVISELTLVIGNVNAWSFTTLVIIIDISDYTMIVTIADNEIW